MFCNNTLLSSVQNRKFQKMSLSSPFDRDKDVDSSRRPVVGRCTGLGVLHTDQTFPCLMGFPFSEILVK